MKGSINNFTVSSDKQLSGARAPIAANKAAAPNRRLPLPFAVLLPFGYSFCGPPVCQAAPGEPRCWARMKTTEFAFVALVSALVSGCAPIPVSYAHYRDDKVTVTVRAVRYYPWPCQGWTRRVIEVYGRRYSYVRGGGTRGSCCLEIPGRNELLFVTGDVGRAIVHIVDEKTHQERHFPAYDSHIGMHIGRDGRGPRVAWEKVEGLSGDLLTINTADSAGDYRGNNFVIRHYINLRESKYIREELDYYDSSGSSSPIRACVSAGAETDATHLLERP
jgi:hypothetical protein